MRMLCGPSRTMGRACLLLLVAGCTSYAPSAEFWPADASAIGVNAGPTIGGGVDAGGGFQAPTTTPGPDSGTAAGDGGSPGGNGAEGGILTADATGPDAGSGTGGIEAGSTIGCSLSVTVTTVTDNGGYSPKNIGAIWVADSSGTFVKSLAVWAQARINHLTLWNSATRAAGLGGNTVDAVTSATLSMHQTHHVTWNCADTKEAALPDGPYRVYFEMTDDNVSGPNMFVNFAKGPLPLTVSPPDAQYFKGVSLVFTP